MLAQRLDSIPGVSAAGAKALIVLGLAAISGALMALVTAGTLVGPVATVMPFVSGFLTGLAALIDPNASH